MKREMIEITQKILDRVHTDSDVMDLADELGVDYGELDYAISNKRAEKTACHNCKYVAMGSGLYPCNQCNRRHILSDHYEPL